MTSPSPAPRAVLGGLVASELVEVTHDLNALDGGGRWAVVLDFEGRLTAARFERWEIAFPGSTETDESWASVAPDSWSSSLDEDTFRSGVADIRERIAAGDVYQVNLCRVLEASVGAGTTLHALHDRLTAEHPAPHAAHIFLPDQDIDVACASPELFLSRDDRSLVSRPIKGTAPTVGELLPKDRAENVMIVDLVRNDLGRVCVPGRVEAPAICAIERHPGLVHLVSTVEGLLRDGVSWRELIEAMFPPGSVVGAPKIAALQVIAELEPVPRGPYCGAIGWIDADEGTAELAVGIRTFWREGRTLRFGTGGGITWDSDPEAEWQETVLKASRLLAVAAG